jgi:hypothetical protein
MSDANALPAPVIPSDPKELLSLIQRSEQGDATTLPALHEMLKKTEFLEACSNVARHAQNALVNKYAGKNLPIREGLEQKMQYLQAELAGPNPSPLERLLAERIAICWLLLYTLEAIYAGKDSLSLDLGNYYQENINRAHRRYLSAIKTLATVRKLAVPVVQVNIAKKQVNVAGPCLTTDGGKEVV